MCINCIEVTKKSAEKDEVMMLSKCDDRKRRIGLYDEMIMLRLSQQIIHI